MPENCSNCWSSGHSKDIQRWISRLCLCYSALGLVYAYWFLLLVETGDEIPDNSHRLTRTMNSCKIGSVAKLEGRASVAVEFLWRQSAPQLASPIRPISLINCIWHAIFNHYDMMIMPWNCQVLLCTCSTKCNGFYATTVAPTWVETVSLLCPSRVEVCYAKIMQMSLCTSSGQLFPGILLRITAFLDVLVYTACSSNRFVFLIRLNFMRCCLRRRYVQ